MNKKTNRTMKTIDNPTIQDSRRAATDFLRAGRKRELKARGLAHGGGARGEESVPELAQRIGDMSDEDFDRAVADGSLTPEQIRKAGEYEYDVYMGDVWVENPDNDDKPEPTYDEFIANPAKYGYNMEADPMKIGRYSRANK